MEGLIMAGQLLLGLTILVGLHELGHLLAAKAFGMKVEKYSIGFPPKVFSFKRGDTEYMLGAIPLGGYVKIAGMIDESLDTNALKEEPKPYEFRSKPAWQRLIVMMGGIIVNVITGIVIFVFLAWSQGETYLSAEQLNENGVVPGEVAREIGFQTGDKVIAVNGESFDRFSDLTNPDMLLNSNSYYTVLRDGEEVRIDVPRNILDRLAGASDIFLQPYRTFKVGGLDKEGGAYKAGILPGDEILAIDGKEVSFYHEVTAELEKHKSREIDIMILQGESGNIDTVRNVKISDEGKLGFYPMWTSELNHQQYNFAEATVAGTQDAFNAIWINAKALGKMFTGDVSPTKSLSGPIGIAQFFGGNFQWVRFWNIVGLLSMILAFMNFLPIPALDGGHVAFLTYEMVSGRKPSDRFLEVSQRIGMLLLLSLMAFAIINDLSKISLPF